MEFSFEPLLFVCYMRIVPVFQEKGYSDSSSHGNIYSGLSQEGSGNRGERWGSTLNINPQQR